MPEAPSRLPLSVLIDRMAGADGERDEAFVRKLAQWLHERARHVRLEVAEALRLRDVVLTLQMRRHVRLVVTGYPPDDLPGQVTLSIDEGDFPHVTLLVSGEPWPDPYEMCTLDYAPAGRPVEVTSGPLSGTRGELVVAATVGGAQQNRVRLPDGDVVTLDGAALRFLV